MLLRLNQSIILAIRAHEKELAKVNGRHNLQSEFCHGETPLRTRVRCKKNENKKITPQKYRVPRQTIISDPVCQIIRSLCRNCFRGTGIEYLVQVLPKTGNLVDP